ncbi:hypothetical protein GYMLUDRAFT_52549 [Collybiopsis luxurians FD-317 M1]|nr:hypothetical protein GYMLUDRAFT_52549 [Collybiopsis luxurians FD-317 M1]
MVDSSAALAQHPPAVKVGGRRLSVSTKLHKLHVPTETESSPQESSPRSNSASPTVPFDDYPRPSDPNQSHQEHREHKEEAPPYRKDKKQGHHGVSEPQNRKEDTMPRRDHHGHGSGKSFGGGGRIVQPAGKSL